MREEKVWSINSDIDSENIKFEVDASATGTFKIEVRSWLIGEQIEALTVNNSKVTFIDVLESKRQVLIVAHAPHPECSSN